MQLALFESVRVYGAKRECHSNSANGFAIVKLCLYTVCKIQLKLYCNTVYYELDIQRKDSSIHSS